MTDAPDRSLTPEGVRPLELNKNLGSHTLIDHIRVAMRETRIAGLLLLALLAILWEMSVVMEWVVVLSWPRLSVVAVRMVEFITSGEIISVFGPTVWRLFVGYIIALGIGVPMGILMGYIPTVNNLFEPLVETLRPIPIVAYIPVVILFFGIGHEMKIFMVAMASFFPILLNAYGGVRGVDSVQVQTARTFGLSTSKVLRHVILPASSPSIFVGLRIGLGIAVIVAVVSEMIVSNDGIGFFILNAQRTFRVPEIYVGVFALGAVGYGLNRLFSLVERRAMAWHIEQEG